MLLERCVNRVRRYCNSRQGKRPSEAAEKNDDMLLPSPKFMGGIKEILGEYGWLPPFDLLWQYGGPMFILAKIIR